MSDLTKIQGEIWEGSDFTIVARVSGPDGAALTQDDVASYAVTVFDLDSDTPSTAIYETTSSTESEVIYSTLQKDGWWTADGTGYNFKYTLKEATMSSVDLEGGHRYAVEVKLTMETSRNATGDAFVMAEVYVKPRLTA